MGFFKKITRPIMRPIEKTVKCAAKVIVPIEHLVKSGLASGENVHPRRNLGEDEDSQEREDHLSLGDKQILL